MLSVCDIEDTIVNVNHRVDQNWVDQNFAVIPSLCQNPMVFLLFNQLHQLPQPTFPSHQKACPCNSKSAKLY